jgi:hypothetical protein
MSKSIIQPEMLQILNYLKENGAIIDDKIEQQFFLHEQDLIDDNDDDIDKWDRRDELIAEQKIKLYFELKKKAKKTVKEIIYIDDFNEIDDIDDVTRKNYDRIIKKYK